MGLPGKGSAVSGSGQGVAVAAARKLGVMNTGVAVAVSSSVRQ
jgi:hypothetical protein